MDNSAVELAIWTAIQANVPIDIEGPPGGGKTAFLGSVGKADNRLVEVVVGSNREPADLGGLPLLPAHFNIEDITGVHHVPPAWAVRLANAHKNGYKGGLLVLDEVTTCVPAMQAAMLRVVQERFVGEQPLGDTVSIVLAQNEVELAANGYPLTPPMINRICKATWHPNIQDVIEGTMSGWQPKSFPAISPDWEQEYLKQAESLWTSFLKHKPTLLHVPPKDDSTADQPWPSPRSWTNAGRLLAASNALKLGKDVQSVLIGGCVGEGTALEFLTWMEQLDLPDPEVILAHPDKIKQYWPTRGDRQYAVLSSVAAAVLAKNNPTRWKNAWKVLAVVATDAGDIAASVARQLANPKNRPAGATAPQEARVFFPLLQKAGLVAA